MYRNLLVSVTVVLLLPVLLVVTPVLASYLTVITVVTNTSFVTRDMYSVYNEQDIDGLVSAGYLGASGLDARVKLDGVEIPFMLDEDLVAFAAPLTTDSSTDFQFSGGNSGLSYFDITVGEGGDITTDDNAGLEIGSDTFDITLDGYIDTATPTGDTPIVGKDGAVELYVEATDGTISADINGTTELTATGISSGEHEVTLLGGEVPSGIIEDVDTDYTLHGDDSSHVTMTDTRVTVTDITRRDDDYYLYRDFGSGYWDGDFEYQFDIRYTASSSVSDYQMLFMLCNTPETNWDDIDTASGDALGIQIDHTRRTWIYELNDGVETGVMVNDYPSIYVGTTYYYTFERDEGVGTYGTLYGKIYSDSARQNLLWSNSFALTEKQDFRYLNLVAPHDYFGSDYTMSYWIQSIDLYQAGVLALYVDDNLEDITPKGAYTITDNANDWVLDWDTIKYLDYYSYTIDDVETVHYQPDSIITDDTMPNNINPGTYDGDITWGVMGNITGLESIGDDIFGGGEDTQSKGAVTDPSYESGTSVVDGAPDELPNMYDEGEVRWIIVAFIVAFIFGFVAYYKTRDLLVQAVVSGIVMAAFCGGGAFGSGWTPYWTVLVFGIEAFLYFVIRQKQYVG